MHFFRVCLFTYIYTFQVKKTLSKIGYPPFGDKNNVLKRVKSYLSCAVNQNKN